MLFFFPLLVWGYSICKTWRLGNLTDAMWQEGTNVRIKPTLQSQLSKKWRNWSFSRNHQILSQLPDYVTSSIPTMWDKDNGKTDHESSYLSFSVLSAWGTHISELIAVLLCWGRGTTCPPPPRPMALRKPAHLLCMRCPEGWFDAVLLANTILTCLQR